MQYAVGPFREHYTERLDADTNAVVDRLVPRLGDYLSARPRPWTIVHGDFRADNLLFGGERVVVVDWQTVGLGPGTADLSYLLGASLDAGGTAASTRPALVDRYVAGLHAPGRRRRPRRRLGRLPPVRLRRADHGDRRLGARPAHRPRRRDVRRRWPSATPTRRSTSTPKPSTPKGSDRAPTDRPRRVLRPPDPRAAAQRRHPPPALAGEPVLRDAPAATGSATWSS